MHIHVYIVVLLLLICLKLRQKYFQTDDCDNKLEGFGFFLTQIWILENIFLEVKVLILVLDVSCIV